MGFLVSPGVDVNEIDLTNVIPAVSTSIGGYAGPFRWGPVDQIVTVSSEKDLVSIYGKPNSFYAKSFFTAASFLKYGNALKVSRAYDSGSLNAVAPTVAGATAGNDSALAAQYTSQSNFDAAASKTGSFFAKYPGDIANGLKVIVITSGSLATDTYAKLFDYVPDTTGEVHILVIDAKGAFSGTTEAILERYSGLSLYTDAKKADGATNYYRTVINNSSSYILAEKLSVGITNADGVTSAGTTAVIQRTGSALVSPLDILVAATAIDVASQVIDAGLITFSDTLFAAMKVGYSVIITLNTANTVAVYTGLVLKISDTGKNIAGTVTANSFQIKVNGTILSSLNVAIGTHKFKFTTAPEPLTFTFVLGADATGASTTSIGTSIAAAGTVTALDLFGDTDLVDVNLIFSSSSGTTNDTVENKLIEISTTRKDCVSFISAPTDISTKTSEGDRLALIVAKFVTSGITRNSYSVFDSTPLYIYNRYQDNYLWIPASGHMAGLCANTDDVAEPWFSPAGFTRGQLLGVTKLGFNPNLASRDTMYKVGVNPITSFAGQGIILYGDKTAQAKPSAFDRINVRRLFIVLEKAIATAAKYQLFELNDEFTRAMFRNMVEPFLRDVKGRRGITDFLVVCDTTNNTGEVIDTNRFVADIYIKPARSINFITLNFIATRTGVEFSEVVGK